jgi:protein-disulfide isomerase
MKLLILLMAGLAALAQSPPPAATESAPVKLNIEHQPSFGPADAPVTIVEFGDLECPSCRAEAPLLR